MKCFYAAICWALSASACVDLAPLPYDAPDSGAADASTGPSVVDGEAARDVAGDPCGTCLTTGPCASYRQACVASAKCGVFYDCMTPAQCWSSSLTDLNNLAPCIVQCSLTAGILSQADPEAMLISPLFTCAQDPADCGSVCAPQPLSADR